MLLDTQDYCVHLEVKGNANPKVIAGAGKDWWTNKVMMAQLKTLSSYANLLDFDCFTIQRILGL